MKAFYLVLLSLVQFSSLYAQFDERPKFVTSSRDDFYHDLKIADIDNDGFKDIITFENIDIKIFKNGGNLFKSQDRKRTYWTSQASSQAFDLADLNSDNLPEFIYYSAEYPSGNKGLVLKKNLGNGDFGPDISLNIPIVSSLTAVDLKLSDLNNDGYTDIIFATSHNIRIYYGTSSFGVFQNAVNVFNDVNNFINQVEVADLNNDSNLDIVFTYGNNEYTDFSVNVLKNTGNSFLNSNLFSIQDNPISNLHCTDINNDGKTDLVFQVQASHEIIVTTNNGNLSFTSNYLQSANYVSFDVADVNGDNFKDIVLEKDDQLNYFPNDQGTFSYSILPITSNNGFDIGKLACEDFNNDGKNDFLFVSDGGYSHIKLILNQNTSFGYKTIISKTINDSDITSLDFDHNGTKDLILPNCWISNNMNGNFGACNFFDNTSEDFMTYSAVGDIDQDGDYDVAGIVNDQLFMFTNQGNNYDFSPVLIEGASCGMVDLQDINSDGKLDLFYILLNYPDPISPVVYRLNQNNSWGSANIITNAISPLTWEYKKVQFTDLNADSKPDFVIPEHQSLRLFINTGSGFSETVRQVSEISGIEALAQDHKYLLSDFNKDGAKDIIMTTYGTDYKYYLSILLNDGNLNFSVQHISYPVDWIISSFDLNDYDGDYDLDLFYISDYMDNRYYENHLNVFDLNTYEGTPEYGPGMLKTIHSVDLFGNASKEVVYTRDKMVIVRENLTTPYYFNPGSGLVYPNPSSNLISFGVPFDQLQTYTIQIFSVIGNPELSGSIYNENNSLDISSLSSGLHLVTITNNATGEVIQTNFIKN
jgi:hypothetical protein